MSLCCFFHARIQEIKKVGKELGIAPTIIRDEELKTRGFGGGWELGLAGLGLGACSGAPWLAEWRWPTWRGIPFFILEETGLCPTPRPDPGKRPIARGKQAVTHSDSDSGSRRVQVRPCLLPLRPAHVSLPQSPGQLSRAFLFLEYTRPRPPGALRHGSLSLNCVPHRALRAGLSPLPTSARSHLLREPSPISRPCGDRDKVFSDRWGRVTVVVTCG